jgi:acetyl-CoA C-acetyltransferase
MEGIKDKVAIIGMGCTRFGELWEKDIQDLIVEAAYEAFEDAGVHPGDIEAAWFGTYLSGYTGQILSKALGLKYVPVTRVENMCATGSDAFRNACYAVACGSCNIALVLGAEKLKDFGTSGLPDTELVMGTWTGSQQRTFRAQTFTAPAHYALMAIAYFNKYRIPPDEGKRLLAMIAVKNHYNGSLHPKAHFQKAVQLEDVLKAPIIAWPLGLFDCCGVSDGAAAAVICRADMARNFKPDPIYVKALQISVGPQEGYRSPKYEWDHVEETHRAGLAAYKEAGVTDPRRQISIAEVHDCFTITEMVIYEDLGFCPRGKAGEDIRAGTFELTGELPVNTDGGLKCFGHPIGASGLRMLYEVYHQLREKAGPRQIRNPSLGLVHNLGGTPGAGTVSVIIVGNEKDS